MRRAGPTLGLTGGIGSGKSTVARALAARGALIVDTDAIARALTAPGGAALPAIAQAFGEAAIAADGALDRAWMRERVFADAAQRERLEAILHPMIGERTWSEAAAAAAGQPVVFDVPLLTERGAHWRRQVDRVLVVDCDEATQVQRVQARNGWPEAQVRAVIAQQASRAARRAIADAVIVNQDLTLDALDAEVATLWRLWAWPAAQV
ncbi:dephospho-CoA kinase [Ideonella sp. 4Y11]|uniref:Dephospho-CoA kinase n=1 Tax=Ideonella aquatica TaxID=2824119 RepID=A0A940YD59_9BURK|nr:dephospho-CoA kinase [Ideonella aquatica]MBQ0958023.1 dephospho-CoA kinase [Ideonella aquatica]